MSKRIALEIIVDHKFSGHHIVLDPGSAVTLRYVEWQDPPQKQPQTATKTAEEIPDPHASRAPFEWYAMRHETEFTNATGLSPTKAPAPTIAMWINATNRATDFIAFARSLETKPEPTPAQEAVEGSVSLDSAKDALGRLKTSAAPPS